jgi:hypothetical protein
LWDFKDVSERLIAGILRIKEQIKQVNNKNQEAYIRMTLSGMKTDVPQ